MSSEPVPPVGGGDESGPAPRTRRRRRALRIGIVLAVVVAIFAGASLAAAAYTERSSFCEHACHEMEPYGATWEKSKHSDIACVHCHIKPGAVQFVKAKGSALREVWVHFTGDVKAPIAVTRHIPDSTCTASDCHPAGSVPDPLTLKSVSATAAAPHRRPAARPRPP